MNPTESSMRSLLSLSPLAVATLALSACGTGIDFSSPGGLFGLDSELGTPDGATDDDGTADQGGGNDDDTTGEIVGGDDSADDDSADDNSVDDNDGAITACWKSQSAAPRWWFCAKIATRRSHKASPLAHASKTGAVAARCSSKIAPTRCTAIQSTTSHHAPESAISRYIGSSDESCHFLAVRRPVHVSTK